MLHIVLFQPEIPPNTGNIIRLCANTGASLHLVHPLGFTLDDKRMRRAGLDYHEWAEVTHYENDQVFFEKNMGKRMFACSTKAQKNYSDVQFIDDDMLLFGPETRGLSEEIRKKCQAIRIPMLARSRSLNLSNAVAIILLEAWRQLDFNYEE
ncbi:MAG: tRNA (cytidine(34)-2'-O)-methyltransferase [Legionellaceae bacterium]|nr:tRNA (cytidine(34)-2'-O)-methyltransferase [Legionellaceae bacterium]